MRSFQVIRTHTSPYQSKNFHQLEAKLIHQIEGLRYGSLLEADLQAPLILITNTHTQLKSLPPEILKQTKLIVHPNSGYDHFAHEQDLWAPIPLVIGHEIRAQAVAEFSLAALFQGISELPQHLSWNHERRWDRRLIKDLPVMVVGYGHIGKIVADTIAALGAKVTVIDPYEKSPFPTFKSMNEKVMEESEVVIACCGLNRLSHHLFNEKFFSRAHPRLLFINGARGKLVDEKALRNFLMKNPAAFAFLDVFEEEPFSEEWHHFPQVWKTSHIAGVHAKLDQGILDFEGKVLRDFMQLNENEFQQKYHHELLQNKWKEGVLL
jgi:D-3-phosphoglycerate dehydrogenase